MEIHCCQQRPYVPFAFLLSLDVWISGSGTSPVRNQEVMIHGTGLPNDDLTYEWHTPETNHISPQVMVCLVVLFPFLAIFWLQQKVYDL